MQVPRHPGNRGVTNRTNYYPNGAPRVIKAATTEPKPWGDTSEALNKGRTYEVSMNYMKQLAEFQEGNNQGINAIKHSHCKRCRSTQPHQKENALNRVPHIQHANERIIGQRYTVIIPASAVCISYWVLVWILMWAGSKREAGSQRKEQDKTTTCG